VSHRWDLSENEIVKSAVFPVRFKEFNDGWIEDFFEPYINPNHSEFSNRISSGNPVKMIITFSYGIDLYKFQIDRFSSRYRNPNLLGNNKILGRESNYLQNSDKDNLEFIETTLPFNDLQIPSEVDLHQKFKFKYFNNNVGGTIKTEDNFNLTPLIPFPNIGNYPPPTGSPANRIEARSGSGGIYLSNEIYYRVSFLRQEHNPLLKTGHIHVGFLLTDPGGIKGNRTEMLSLITQAIQQTLANL
jgi:hypothetical protein